MRAWHLALWISVIGAGAARGDTIRILSRAESSPTHCLGQTSSGYVSHFDGNTFVVFTALASCGAQDRVPGTCMAHVTAIDRAPTEVKLALAGSSVQIFRHVVAATEVVGITFDDKLVPHCKAPALEIDTRPGFLKQPTSYKPIGLEELRSLKEHVITAKDRVLITNWTETLNGTPVLAKGDVIDLKSIKDLPSEAERKGLFVLAGREPSASDTERYVLLRGKLNEDSGQGMGSKFEITQVFTAMSVLGVKNPPQSNNPKGALKPVRVANKRTTVGGFNWQGETTALTTLKMRLLSIQSGADRMVQIESDAPDSTVTHMKALRRAN